MDSRKRRIIALFMMILAGTALFAAACEDDENADDNGKPGDDGNGESDDTDDGDTETDEANDTDDKETSEPFRWTFDDGWDGFEHGYGDVEFSHNADDGTLELNAELTGPQAESSFAQEFFAADWTGVTHIEVVLRTFEHTTGAWRIELDTGYAWTPCISLFDHPADSEWTTVTVDILETCGEEVMLDVTQALFVGVITGDEATEPETVHVAVDSVTVY